MDLKVLGKSTERWDAWSKVTGAAELIPQELETLREQGRFVILSSPRGKTAFDFHDLCNYPSFEIIGAHNRSHAPLVTLKDPWTLHRDAELYFDLAASGAINMEKLISLRASYTDAQKVYAMLLKDVSNIMGVVFEWEI